jgi:hypothetical protein
MWRAQLINAYKRWWVQVCAQHGCEVVLDLVQPHAALAVDVMLSIMPDDQAGCDLVWLPIIGMILKQFHCL